MTTENTTAKFITTQNLKKMNTVKLSRLFIRIFGASSVVPSDRQTLIYRINGWMTSGVVSMIEAMVGFNSEEVEKEMAELASFYRNLSTAFKEHMIEITSINVAAISGWRFDYTWKLINGGLKNQEIAEVLSSSVVGATTGYESKVKFNIVEHPAMTFADTVISSSNVVTAKDVANVRYGQVTDNMKKRAAKVKKSVEVNEEIIVESVPAGFFGGLGLTDGFGNAIGF